LTISLRIIVVVGMKEACHTPGMNLVGSRMGCADLLEELYYILVFDIMDYVGCIVVNISCICSLRR
jgi:hypothetical protein